SENAAPVKTPVTETAGIASPAGKNITSIDAHVEAINELVPRLRQITGELEQQIGQHILAIKAAAPSDWEAIVKDRCGISRSRAFELMHIGDGSKTVEQTRRETKLRQDRFLRKLRYNGREKEIAADTQLTQLQAAHSRQIERYKAEIAQLGDAEALRSQRDE